VQSYSSLLPLSYCCGSALADIRSIAEAKKDYGEEYFSEKGAFTKAAIEASNASEKDLLLQGVSEDNDTHVLLPYAKHVLRDRPFSPTDLLICEVCWNLTSSLDINCVKVVGSLPFVYLLTVYAAKYIYLLVMFICPMHYIYTKFPLISPWLLISYCYYQYYLPRYSRRYPAADSSNYYLYLATVTGYGLELGCRPCPQPSSR
jgi:hypothetical protein